MPPSNRTARTVAVALGVAPAAPLVITLLLDHTDCAYGTGLLFVGLSMLFGASAIVCAIAFAAVPRWRPHLVLLVWAGAAYAATFITLLVLDGASSASCPSS